MKKLEFLIRQNERRNEIENCKQQFSEIFGIQMSDEDFLSIEQTDLLINKFYENFKTSTNKVCEKYAVGNKLMSAAIRNLFLKFGDEEGYLITKQTETCGLIRISSDVALAKYIEVINLDGDSLGLLSIDQSKGIYIDYFEEANELGTSWYYELCFWEF